MLADRAISSPGRGSVLSELSFAAVIAVAPWFLGRLERERSRRGRAFAAVAAHAATERAERAEAAIKADRIRIGSELEDVIAHNLSAMVIQAGGARRWPRNDQAQARESILAVERTGRDALADLRRLLGVLRKEDDPGALAPQPGLDQMPALLDAIGATGRRCRLQPTISTNTYSTPF
jgi:signal transduction histidine kinase